MKNIPLLVITLVSTLVLIVGMAIYFSQNAASSLVVDQAKLTNGARLTKGPETAQVTLVEFSDLQCPACKAIQPLVQEVSKQYPDKVRVVYRHFPLTQVHPYATLAAQASEVAAEQGKFWEMHDKLFATQSDWAELDSEEKATEKFAEYAQELQIDKATFLARIQASEVKQRVADDAALAAELKLNSTPTLFVNGKKVTAPQQLLQTVGSLVQAQ
jgi:protein-disulfide isomerase